MTCADPELPLRRLPALAIPHTVAAITIIAAVNLRPVTFCRRAAIHYPICLADDDSPEEFFGKTLIGRIEVCRTNIQSSALEQLPSALSSRTFGRRASRPRNFRKPTQAIDFQKRRFAEIGHGSQSRRFSVICTRHQWKLNQRKPVAVGDTKSVRKATILRKSVENIVLARLSGGEGGIPTPGAVRLT